jgi:hypothetical protein
MDDPNLLHPKDGAQKMSAQRIIILVILLPFAVLTALALADVGYWGILAPHFQSWGEGQVLADLVIVCSLACVWMIKDAKARDTSPWPFVLITLVAGSFGPLLYLFMRRDQVQ